MFCVRDPKFGTLKVNGTIVFHEHILLLTHLAQFHAISM